MESNLSSSECRVSNIKTTDQKVKESTINIEQKGDREKKNHKPYTSQPTTDKTNDMKSKKPIKNKSTRKKNKTKTPKLNKQTNIMPADYTSGKMGKKSKLQTQEKNKIK